MRTMLSMSWTEKSFAVRGEPPHLMCCFKPPRFVSCPYVCGLLAVPLNPSDRGCARSIKTPGFSFLLCLSRVTIEHARARSRGRGRGRYSDRFSSRRPRSDRRCVLHGAGASAVMGTGLSDLGTRGGAQRRSLPPASLTSSRRGSECYRARAECSAP